MAKFKQLNLSSLVHLNGINGKVKISWQTTLTRGGGGQWGLNRHFITWMKVIPWKKVFNMLLNVYLTWWQRLIELNWLVHSHFFGRFPFAALINILEVYKLKHQKIVHNSKSKGSDGSQCVKLQADPSYLKKNTNFFKSW